ncbi:MAG: alpha/beta fold hydrolase [Bdellovibrionales bacterium]|nr:alpha/beta fold hydrolase [Bdellovibrionales bacterium]
MEQIDFVLLRGLAREAGHWGNFVDRVESQDFCQSAYALDLPGMGRFHKISSPLSVGEMAEFIMAEIEQLPRNPRAPLVLLSVSLGSMVAIELAHRYPQKFSKIILMNVSVASLSPIHHRLMLSAWKSMVKIMAQKSPRAREQAVLQMVSNNAEAQGRVLSQWEEIAKKRSPKPANVLRQLIAAAAFRLPKQRPLCPMVIFASESDRMVDVRCSKKLAQHWQIPIHTHPSAGHELALDAPEWVIEKVAESLSL